MSYGSGLAEAFGCLIGTIVILFVVTVVLFCLNFFSADEVVVKKPIVPEIRLEIKNNKVDTLYVYKIK